MVYKKIVFVSWLISVTCLISVTIFFLVDIAFNITLTYGDGVVGFIGGIASYMVIVVFLNLCKIERQKTQSIALWIFWVNLVLIQILVLPFGIEIFNPDWAHPLGLIWLSFITILYCSYLYLRAWYERKRDQEEQKKTIEEIDEYWKNYYLNKQG